MTDRAPHDVRRWGHIVPLPLHAIDAVVRDRRGLVWTVVSRIWHRGLREWAYVLRPSGAFRKHGVRLERSLTFEDWGAALGRDS